jgi:SAM-dependent methyltransferase
MKRIVVEYLVCPNCLPREEKLLLQADESSGEEIWKGFLECGHCDSRYPIDEGIACLLPMPPWASDARESKYERGETVSSYLWAHYSDLYGDPDSSGSYAEWAALIEPGAELALDVGCAAGRFAFELSRKSDFIIGLDSSRGLIRSARELLINRRASFELATEGRLTEERMVQLPEPRDGWKVEFIVGDALALPFPGGVFSTVSSLNLIDKLPKPLKHLGEIGRVAKRRGAQFLFSDPFSWSPEICGEDEWLGGLTDGEFAGPGLENIVRILKEGKAGAYGKWNIERLGEIWWKIRNHRNHFELIRSCFVKARR